MKKGTTNLVIILDKSGSMRGLEKDVIGGYNSLIKEQRKDKGEVKVTTILFNTIVNFINENDDVKKVHLMKDSDYVVGGCTALLDAIGNAIRNVEKRYMSIPEEERPEHTIFSIMTDGEENSSIYFTYPLVKNMIKEHEEKGWIFLFQAANIDAFEEGQKLGIKKERARNFKATSEGVREMMYCLSSNISNLKED